MGGIDFPTWLDMGSYGGLACSLLVPGALAAYALGRRGGTPRQLARAMLLCLGAALLALVPIWWRQTRFDLYGPILDPREILVALLWSALIGWCVPLYALVRYIIRARPLPAGQGFSIRLRTVPGPALAALGDPARKIEPLGRGRAWGQLVPMHGELAERPLPLTRQLILLGRELDNDIVVEDERASRHHAEIHWDHGHPQLLDRASMNGILLNGQTVRGSVPLRAGDVLQFGERRYRFELLAGQDGAAGATEDPEATRKTAGVGAGVQSGGPLPSGALAPMVALMGVDRGFEFMRWELRGAVSVIGRDAECEVRLPDSSVSRRHAQIVRQSSGFFLSDLQSSNGTTINGVPLEAPTVLRAGDLVRVGEVTLRCERVVSGIAPPPPAINPSVNPSVNPSAPTTALADLPGDQEAVNSSAPTAPPQSSPEPQPVGALTGLLRAVTASRSVGGRSSPRLAPPRLHPSQPPRGNGHGGGADAGDRHV